MPRLCERLTPLLLNKLCKADRRIDLKLLTMATGSTDKAKIWSYNKEVFDELAAKQHRDRMNRILDRISWDDSHNILWQTCGVYTLLPETAAGQQNNENIFTGVRCNALTGAGAEVIPGVWGLPGCVV